MKQIKKLLFSLIVLFLAMNGAHAAGSVSVSASSNYITTGSSVTFYIYVNNAAAWSLSGYGIGATSGCSLGDDGVGDSGTGNNVSKTIASVTCRATSEGTVGFVVTGNISSANGNDIIKTNVNTSKSVTVQKPREKDTNNYLKSLGVKDYSLIPEFNKETLEYSVTVPSTVDKVTLEASLESGYASMTGTGEFEVNEGVNTFEVNVTSETGVGRVYKVTVNVQDDNPIEVEIGSSKYTIMKNAKTLEKPSTYESTTVKIRDFDIPAFYSEISKFTLVGAKDTKGEAHFLIFNQAKNSYELYNENKASEQLLYIEKMEDTKDGFTKKTKTINGASYEVLVSDKDESIILVKAMNIKTGDINLYQYDEKTNSYIIYNDSLVVTLEEEIAKYKDVIFYFCIALCVCFLFLLILLFRRPKRKKEKKKEEKIPEVKIEKLEMEEKKEPVVEQKSEIKMSKKQLKKKRKQESKLQKEESKEEVKKEEKEKDVKKETKNRTKEEALKQVSDAASIIEEYEKTISLNKEELKKKKKELEENQVAEETMYDIFEEDKKKKRK